MKYIVATSNWGRSGSERLSSIVYVLNLVFSSKNFSKIDAVAFSFVFDIVQSCIK